MRSKYQNVIKTVTQSTGQYVINDIDFEKTSLYLKKKWTVYRKTNASSALFTTVHTHIKQTKLLH